MRPLLKKAMIQKKTINLQTEQYQELLKNCLVVAERNRQRLLYKKTNTSYNTQFNFLREHFEPQSNIQIL